MINQQRRDGGGREPQRHAEELRERHNPEHLPCGCVRGCRHYLTWIRGIFPLFATAALCALTASCEIVASARSMKAFVPADSGSAITSGMPRSLPTRIG